ncbi:MAG: nuclear transport factor 2 family protein [Bacteroidetes bacterium]|nr:MAG: nuclear transport factor 2 family protein [Bacteroidota bacterium]
MTKNTFFQFIDAINRHNVEAIYSLMTDDHTFIDAYGNQVVGKNNMKAAWIGYFQWFPDHKIEITDLFAEENKVAAFGFASGTFQNKKSETNENYWHLPAAWKAVVSGDKIRRWQVYADTKRPFDIIEKNK